MLPGMTGRKNRSCCTHSPAGNGQENEGKEAVKGQRKNGSKARERLRQKGKRDKMAR